MNTKPEKAKYINESKEERQLREAKERLAATKSFQVLWKDYMDGHTKGWNMDSYGADKALFARFKRFKSSGKFEKLPKPLQHTFSVGYSYLIAMANLGKNNRVKAFVKAFTPKLGSMNLADTNFKKLYALIQRNPKTYKALTDKDLEQAVLALNWAYSELGKVPTAGRWGAKAKKLVQKGKYSKMKIDGPEDAKRVSKGFKVILKNTILLQAKKKRQDV